MELEGSASTRRGRSRTTSRGITIRRATFYALGLCVVMCVAYYFSILSLALSLLTPDADTFVVRAPTPTLDNLATRVATIERLQALHSSKIEAQANKRQQQQQHQAPQAEQAPMHRDVSKAEQSFAQSRQEMADSMRRVAESLHMQTVSIQRLQRKFNRVERVLKNNNILLSSLSPRSQQALPSVAGLSSIIVIVPSDQVVHGQLENLLGHVNASLGSLAFYHRSAASTLQLEYHLVAKEEVLSAARMSEWLLTLALPFQVTVTEYLGMAAYGCTRSDQHALRARGQALLTVMAW
jgi:hypothetical protein